MEQSVTGARGEASVHELVVGIDAGLRTVVGSLENGREVTDRIDAGWKGVGEAVAEIARTARRAKVLAVNASIEAAYVDGMGTGFGIVAERMRALASSTADAASDVHAIVTATRGRAGTVRDAIRNALESIGVIGKLLESASAGADGASGDASAAVSDAFTRAVDQCVEVRRHGDAVRDGIKSMHEATDKAGAIVDAVAEISAESQLLALNAAIEAARAGDRGRGFTVIADEIGRLALETQRATDGITETIAKLRVRGERLAVGSERGSDEMDVVIRDVHAAREALRELGS